MVFLSIQGGIIGQKKLRTYCVSQTLFAMIGRERSAVQYGTPLTFLDRLRPSFSSAGQDGAQQQIGLVGDCIASLHVGI